MSNKISKNGLLFAVLIIFLCFNSYPMKKITISEKFNPETGYWCRTYPYDHTKTTFAEFSKTEEGKNFLASSKNELRPRDLFIFCETKISDDLEAVVYKTSSDEVKVFIEDYKLGLAKNDRKSLVKSVLLQGKTGTGKTKMVSMIAKRIGIELVSIRTSMLGNSYEDSDFINLKETILPLIKSGKPYIIALEDFGNLRIKSLDWLCGVIGCENILFIFITDKKVGSLDQRFVNSQICKKIEVQLPDKNSRRQIIEYTLARKKKNLNEGRANLNYDSLDLVEIADKTNNFNIFSLNGLLENTFDDAFDLAYKDTSSDEILKIVITKKIFSEQFDKMQKTRKRYGAVEDEN